MYCFSDLIIYFPSFRARSRLLVAIVRLGRFEAKSEENCINCPNLRRFISYPIRRRQAAGAKKKPRRDWSRWGERESRVKSSTVWPKKINFTISPCPSTSEQTTKHSQPFTVVIVPRHRPRHGERKLIQFNELYMKAALSEEKREEVWYLILLLCNMTTWRLLLLRLPSMPSCNSSYRLSDCCCFMLLVSITAAVVSKKH